MKYLLFNMSIKLLVTDVFICDSLATNRRKYRKPFVIDFCLMLDTNIKYLFKPGMSPGITFKIANFLNWDELFIYQIIQKVTSSCLHPSQKSSDVGKISLRSSFILNGILINKSAHNNNAQQGKWTRINFLWPVCCLIKFISFRTWHIHVCGVTSII